MKKCDTFKIRIEGNKDERLKNAIPWREYYKKEVVNNE
jgi:hypothetical protein